MNKPFVLVFAALLGLAACGGERPRATGNPRTDGGAPLDSGVRADGGVGVDGGPVADGGVDPAEEPPDLGSPCAGGCNLATCVLEDEGCAGGVCVWHGALGAAYCSRPCVSTCRPGYTCQRTADDEGPVCVSDTPSCGNGRIEYGEACDDSNTAAGDLCAADCSAVTTPPSGGQVTTSFDGRAATTASGDDPVVVAERMDGILFFRANTSEVTYGLRLPDDAGPAPYTALLEAGLIESVNGNLCPYQGAASAAISRLDLPAKEVAGQASLLMVCMGGNCEFGCNPQFTLEVQFDLRWVELQ